MIKIGDVVQNRLTKIYGTVHHSTFGFSIHFVSGTGLNKTLGMSADETLEKWQVVDMPSGYQVGKYGGIVKMKDEDKWLFVKTHRSSVGGNAVSMEVMDIDNFINNYKDVVFDRWKAPDIRPIKLNEKGGYLLNTLELETFEQVFSGRIASMGKLLWYYPEERSVKSKYPLFRKAVYEKYGIKAAKRFDEEKREYYALAIGGSEN